MRKGGNRRTEIHANTLCESQMDRVCERRWWYVHTKITVDVLALDVLLDDVDGLDVTLACQASSLISFISIRCFHH